MLFKIVVLLQTKLLPTFASILLENKPEKGQKKKRYRFFLCFFISIFYIL